MYRQCIETYFYNNRLMSSAHIYSRSLIDSIIFHEFLLILTLFFFTILRHLDVRIIVVATCQENIKRNTRVTNTIFLGNFKDKSEKWHLFDSQGDGGEKKTKQTVFTEV